MVNKKLIFRGHKDTNKSLNDKNFTPIKSSEGEYLLNRSMCIDFFSTQTPIPDFSGVSSFIKQMMLLAVKILSRQLLHNPDPR